MSQDALELVTLRNNFYRDNYRRVVTALLTCFLVVILLVGVIFYMFTHQAKPVYFATTSTGSIIKLQPLTRPNQSDATVLAWANEAIVASYSYNFVDFRKALQSASQYFTDDGWKNFLAALKNSNNLEAVQKRKLIMNAVATGAPIIVKKGVLNGRYSWQVQLPVLVSLQSASEVIPQPLMINLLITRVSPLDNPKGIAISQFVAAPRTGAQATA